MNEPPAAPDARPHGYSGKKVLIFAIFLAPAVIIPLLLSGVVTEREVSILALKQRRAEWPSVGGFALSEPEWEPVEGWPEAQLHPMLMQLMPPLPEEGPAAWHEAMGDDGAERYLDSFRVMPWALVLQIPNSRALPESLMRVVEVRLLAAAVLDPGNPEDRACWQRLDADISEGLILAEGERPPRRRDRELTAGERAAEAILTDALEAIESDDPVARVRQALCPPSS